MEDSSGDERPFRVPAAESFDEIGDIQRVLAGSPPRATGPEPRLELGR